MEDPGIYAIYLPAPSNRSPLVAFGDLKVAGGDLLEGPGRGAPGEPSSPNKSSHQVEPNATDEERRIVRVGFHQELTAYGGLLWRPIFGGRSPSSYKKFRSPSSYTLGLQVLSKKVFGVGFRGSDRGTATRSGSGGHVGTPDSDFKIEAKRCFFSVFCCSAVGVEQ